MRERMSDWWSDGVARRGAANLLFDLWWFSVVFALMLGLLLGAILTK